MFLPKRSFFLILVLVALQAAVGGALLFEVLELRQTHPAPQTPWGVILIWWGVILVLIARLWWKFQPLDDEG